MQLIVMSGMSAAFTALFGTPITAAFFAMEVVTVGKMQYYSIIPCIISAATAFGMVQFFGVEPTHFALEFVPEFGLVSFLQVMLISIGCAIIGVLFCKSLHFAGHNFKRVFPNRYLRILAGSVIVMALTYLVGTYDYNGAGMNVVSRAVSGEAEPFAFVLKILFTAITLGCGFRGGEIVPTLFIGSTFGCVAASVIGLDPGFGAAIGMVALFCGVVNCPVASIFLSVELFGAEGILLFVIACGVSYMLSGYSGLYGSQKFAYSKFKDKYINVKTK
jgi:H+/Cl- antiporter ClcA